MLLFNANLPGQLNEVLSAVLLSQASLYGRVRFITQVILKCYLMATAFCEGSVAFSGLIIWSYHFLQCTKINSIQILHSETLKGMFSGGRTLRPTFKLLMLCYFPRYTGEPTAAPKFIELNRYHFPKTEISLFLFPVP